MRLSAHFWHLIWVSFSVAQRGWKTTDPRGRRGNHHRQEDRVLPRTVCWGKTKEKHRNIWAVGLWGRKRNSKSGLDCRCRVIWGCDYSFYWEGFPHNEGDFYTCLHHTQTHTHTHTHHHHYYHCHYQIQQSGLRSVSSMDSYLKYWLLSKFISFHTFSLYKLFKVPFTSSSLSHTHRHTG